MYVASNNDFHNRFSLNFTQLTFAIHIENVYPETFATMKLYHTPGSPPSRSVLMTIRNLGLEVDIQIVDLATGEHLTPEFVKLNPMHQVPVLVDADFVLSESRAIQAYLVNSKKPGSDLYPSDPQTRAIVDQLLYFDATAFFSILKTSLVSSCF